jgi:hypothetical protein
MPCSTAVCSSYVTTFAWTASISSMLSDASCAISTSGRPWSHPRSTCANSSRVGLSSRYASAIARQAVLDGPDRDRTCDLGIKSPLLYQLSYRPQRPV